MGEIPKSMASTARLQCQAVFGEEGEENQMIEQYWRFESLGSKIDRKQHLTEQEELALSIFRRTIRNIGDRYEIGLPWKAEDL